jgi:hypothetical protein
MSGCLRATYVALSVCAGGHAVNIETFGADPEPGTMLDRGPSNQRWRFSTSSAFVASSIAHWGSTLSSQTRNHENTQSNDRLFDMQRSQSVHAATHARSVEKPSKSTPRLQPIQRCREGNPCRRAARGGRALRARSRRTAVRETAPAAGVRRSAAAPPTVTSVAEHGDVAPLE